MTITLRKHRQTPFPTDGNPASINRERMAVRFCGALTCSTPNAPLSHYNNDSVCGVCSNRRADEIIEYANSRNGTLSCSACGEQKPDGAFSPQPNKPARRGRDHACRECSNQRRNAARMMARVRS